MTPSASPPRLSQLAAETFLRDLRERVLPEAEAINLPDLSPRQVMAAESEADELLFGGAAGGGKTFLIAWLMRQASRSGLVLRRTFPELEDSIVQECLRLYGDPSRYNSTKHVWTFPGRRIRLGYCERFQDVLQYQSAEFDAIAVDEVTQWEDPRVYEYLLSRLRSTRRGQRVRMVACTNPGNVGGAWVIRRWRPWLDPSYADPAEEGELRWFRRDERGDDVECAPDHPDAMSRTYIHSRLEDNPHLGEDYRRALASLPEPYRSQLRDGDWSIGVEDDPWQLIPTAWIDRAIARWSRPTGNMDSIGVDVARGGRDQTVLAPRYGRTVAELVKRDGKDTPDGPAVVKLIVDTIGREHPCIGLDVIGVGTSPLDILSGTGYDVTPINGAEAARDHRGEPLFDRSGRLRIRNMRAAVYWHLRELLESDEIDLPPDQHLRSGLIAARWKITPTGIQIREKDEVKASIGRSPDEADAVAYACWVTPLPRFEGISDIIGG